MARKNDKGTAPQAETPVVDATNHELEAAQAIGAALAAFVLPNAPTEGVEESDRTKRTIVPETYKLRYTLASPDGQSCGDALALALAEATKTDGKADPAKLARVATANGVDLGRWSHLNVGQQRMNLGNVLRSALKKGKVVFVDGVAFGQAAPAAEQTA